MNTITPIVSLPTFTPDMVEIDDGIFSLAYYNPEAVDVLNTPEVSALIKYRGQAVKIKTIKAMPLRKNGIDGLPINQSTIVLKESVFVGRVGVNYDNQKDVIAKRESGELPKENAGMKWGEWVPGLEKYVKRHVNKLGELNLYFRFSTVKGAFKYKQVQYFVNGVPCDKETAQNFCTKFEDDSKDLDCFDIHIKNIVEVNDKPVIA
jgi:hypothetical protein